MTNNEHNEKILAEIMTLQERIKVLQAGIKPADDIPEVDLLTCNSGALEARAQKFGQQAKVKAAIEEVISRTSAPLKRRVPRDAARDER